jgi:hypothetical protein
MAGNSNLIVYVNPDPNNPGNTNGGLYSLPPATYTDKQWAMTDITGATALYLLSEGTVVANIPDDGTGIGGWCYLINLPALQPPPVDAGEPADAAFPQTPGARPKLTATQLLRSVGALMRLTSPAAPGSPDAKVQADLNALITAHAADLGLPKAPTP